MKKFGVMMEGRFALLSSFLLFLMLFSCQEPTDNVNITEENIELNPIESFDPSDVPVDQTFESLSFTSPWGYNKIENSTRLYPLLVSGYWDEGAGEYSAVNRRYPSFVLSYQKDTEADGQFLGQWIKNAIAAGYRIDINRIYLTGFSQGGSGSFPLARGMYSEDLYFAAIIRVAGQSEPDIGNDIASKTALWYHIGLIDTEMRIDTARSALASNRSYACNSNAVETIVSDTIDGYERTTVKLTRSGRLLFLYSEYAGMEHDPFPCYKDKAMFPWLFSHSLKFNE